MSLADYQLLVDDLVRDRDQVIAPASRDIAIGAAVLQYSADRPRDVVVDLISTGGARLALPAGWVTDFSTLQSIEYPVGQLPTAEIPLSDVRLYRAPDGTDLILPVDLRDAEVVRMTYSAPHNVDSNVDTIRVSHRQAVASYAGMILCGQLAAYYASESEPTIQADTVDRANKSALFRARAKDLQMAYNSVIGQAPSDRQQAASVTVDVRRDDSLGLRRLFHPPGTWPR